MLCIVVSRSYDFLLGKFSLVLLFDSNFLEGRKFLLLDPFDLKSFISQLLSDFATFFEVVKSVVLCLLGVGRDLRADGGSVVAEVHLLLIFDDAFLLLGALLFLNDTEERVTLQLCLLRKHFFALKELLLSSNVQITSLTGSFFGLRDFLGTGSTLTFFEGTFLTEGINLRLSISSTLLEVSEALDFLFFLSLDLVFFNECQFFTVAFVGFITDNFQIFILLLLNLFGLLAKSNLVDFFYFSNHLLVALLLLLKGSLISSLQDLNVLKHLNFFFFE